MSAAVSLFFFSLAIFTPFQRDSVTYAQTFSLYVLPCIPRMQPTDMHRTPTLSSFGKLYIISTIQSEINLFLLTYI